VPRAGAPYRERFSSMTRKRPAGVNGAKTA
jgi:hypothetical protein